MAKKKRPGPRPRNHPDMKYRISIRVTPAEGDDWTAYARAEGRNLSDWGRRMIRIALGQRPERPEDLAPGVQP